MKDRFEQFIKDHQNELDVNEPRPEVWNKVNAELQKQKRQLRLKYTAVAASVLLVISAGVWFTQKKTVPPPLTQHGTENSNTITPEMQEAESYYSTIVEVRRSELNKYYKDYPDLGKEFEKEVRELNILYSQLKEEYKNSGGREAVLKAMVENLQAQVQITGRQLQIIRTVKQKEEKNKPNV